jgi:hypothetical protein
VLRAAWRAGWAAALRGGAGGAEGGCAGAYGAEAAECDPAAGPEGGNAEGEAAVGQALLACVFAGCVPSPARGLPLLGWNECAMPSASKGHEWEREGAGCSFAG